LSKKVLSGEAGVDEVTLGAASLYEKAGVDLVLGRTATAIDRDRRTLRLDDGRTLPWDGLALVTGARPRLLPVPGHALAGIHVLRTLDEALALRAAFRPGARLVVVGGGYIGLEVAASAASAGLAVTVLEAAPRLMARAVSPVLSEHVLSVHRAHGVDVRLGCGVTAFEGGDRVTAVVTTEGTIPADLVVVGVGAVPETALAEAAGLATDDGILVDAFARTSDPAIVAAGDCTRFPSLLYGRPLRLESVQNAVDQAEAAARTLCGHPEPYRSVPWFWSDQYDVKLQIAGLQEGHDEAFLSGDPGSGAFSVAYRREGRLIAVEAVNAPRDYMAARRTIATGGAGDVDGLRRLAPAPAAPR
jgi:3-phenylpropionate/trans-cinnamate dioxygenase ferredoxin reductase subunit